MPDYKKITAGEPGFLVDFPGACICGSQASPQVASGIAYGVPGGGEGQIYICRACGVQIAREFGLVKGEEHKRLLTAADAMEQMQAEIDTRQETINRWQVKMGEDFAMIEMLKSEIERKRGEILLLEKARNEARAMLTPA